MDECSLCGAPSFVMGVGEWLLCESCAELAYPGLRERMRHECRICRGEGPEVWN
jgi:hypothetical protein